MRKIEVKKSPGKGRGVFARRDLEKGEVVEKCELLVFPETDNLPGNLHDYVYKFTKSKSAIALGCGSLYNHSRRPNTNWRMGRRHVTFVARHKIRKGQEVTISYGYRKEDFI